MGCCFRFLQFSARWQAYCAVSQQVCAYLSLFVQFLDLFLFKHTAGRENRSKTLKGVAKLNMLCAAHVCAFLDSDDLARFTSTCKWLRQLYAEGFRVLFCCCACVFTALRLFRNADAKDSSPASYFWSHILDSHCLYSLFLPMLAHTERAPSDRPRRMYFYLQNLRST